MRNTRNLKVTYTAKANSNRVNVFLPKISMDGYWLLMAGFQVGDQIKVDVSENRLVIEKEVSHA